MEVTLDGVGHIYYVCPMTKHNVGVRKMAIDRAIQLLIKNTPHNFYKEIKQTMDIPRSVFWVREAA